MNLLKSLPPAVRIGLAVAIIFVLLLLASLQVLVPLIVDAVQELRR